MKSGIFEKLMDNYMVIFMERLLIFVERLLVIVERPLIFVERLPADENMAARPLG